MKVEVKTPTSLSPLFLLFLVFLVLKLTHYIAWSWLWVTAPLWIPFGILALFAGFCLAVAAILALVDR